MLSARDVTKPSAFAENAYVFLQYVSVSFAAFSAPVPPIMYTQEAMFISFGFTTYEYSSVPLARV